MGQICLCSSSQSRALLLNNFGVDFIQKSPDYDEEEINEDEVFQIVEDMPGFPGGEGALMTYLAGTPYPPIARENGIEGIVYVQFVIDRTGTVTKAEVIRGQDPMLDKAALKRVKAMPAWSPGKQRGKPVKVIFRVRIAFKLN